MRFNHFCLGTIEKGSWDGVASLPSRNLSEALKKIAVKEVVTA